MGVFFFRHVMGITDGLRERLRIPEQTSANWLAHSRLTFTFRAFHVTDEDSARIQGEIGG